MKRTRWPKNTIRFTILGDPKPKRYKHARNRKTGMSIIRKHEETVLWETTIAGQAFKYRPPLPLECPIALGALFFRPIPSYIRNSKKKLQRAINLELVPITKPDIKNLIASLEDALTEIFWLDDNQIVQYISIDGLPTGKYFSNQPRIEIAVVPMPHLGK